MERQRRLGGSRTPCGRRRFVDRGQLDAADADMHFGGLAASERLMRARRSRWARRTSRRSWRSLASLRWRCFLPATLSDLLYPPGT